jgi:transposase
MDIRFGTRNVRLLCRLGLWKTEVQALVGVKMNSVEVQLARWDRDGIEPQYNYTGGMKVSMCGKPHGSNQLLLNVMTNTQRGLQLIR